MWSKKQAVALTAIGLMSAVAWAQNVATVDGVGGNPTSDPIYTVSYATVNAALTDVRTSETVAGTVIEITTPALAESAGVKLDLLYGITVQSTASGGTHWKIAPSGIGLSGAACAIVVIQRTYPITLKNLIITPNDGAAGEVNARAIQHYFYTATPNPGETGNFNLENCYFTAIRPTGHPNAGQPILDPFTPAETSRANRLANLRAFSGGGANNMVELRFVGTAESNSMMYYNFKNTIFTHSIVSAVAAKGGGIVLSRTRNFVCNIDEGCVFSYNDGGGIRALGTLQSNTTTITVTGKYTNPVFFIYNGWMEDSANTGRNEGIQNDGSDISIEHAYFIGNFQEGLDKVGLGNVVIKNSYFANNQKDLDPNNGAPPNVVGAYNVKLTGGGNYTLENCTIFNGYAGGANQGAINWTGATASKTLSLKNVICAGAGDILLIGGTAAVNYVEDNCGIVQSGSHALSSIVIGSGVSTNISDRVTADPLFISTTFAPSWQGLGVKPSNLTDYLAVNNSAYRSTRGGSNPIDVNGANPDSPLPVSLTTLSFE